MVQILHCNITLFPYLLFRTLYTSAMWSNMSDFFGLLGLTYIAPKTIFFVTHPFENELGVSKAHTISTPHGMFITVLVKLWI